MSLIRVTLISLVLWLGQTSTTYALPPTTDLVGCPLMVQPHPAPQQAWQNTTLSDSGVIASHPSDWSVEQDGSTLSLESPDGQAWMSIRWSRGAQGEHLDQVRRDVELLELGPTHLSQRCESRSKPWFEKMGRWQAVHLSVTRRAFGMQRRSFALFASYGAGSITAIVTVKWRKTSADAIALTRQLLSRLRVDPASVQGDGQARDEGDPRG